MGLDFMTDNLWRKLYDGKSGDGDSIHSSTMVAVTELSTDCYSYMDLSELKNITEHLLTDNELFFSFVYFTVYTS